MADEKESDMQTTETANRKERKATDRRAFLRLTGAGVAAGGIAAVTMGGEAEAARAAAPRQDGGYRETDHVRKFYDSARF